MGKDWCGDMNTFLDNNITLLKQHRPDLWEQVRFLLTEAIPGEVYTAPNKQVNMRWSGPDGQMIDLHLHEDPMAGCLPCLDQLQGKEGQIIFILGFGLGYECLAVTEHYGILNQIKIVDYSPLFFVQALKNVDLAKLIINRNVHLYLNTTLSDLDEIVLHADRWYLLKDPAHLLVLKQITRTNPDFYQTAPQRLLRLVTAQAQQSYTTIRQAKALLSNSFHNFSSMVRHPPLQSLAGSMKDHPAILVSGGPSLKKNIHLLKGKEEHAVIIAVDTAVPRLLDHGIVPHFVVALDFKHRNADPLWNRWQELGDSSLVFVDISTPFIPKFFQGTNQYYVIGESLVSGWFNEMLGQTDQLIRASTVAQLGFFAAHTMGCDPVIMIGQDMAYEGEIDEKRIEQEGMVQVPGVDGNMLYTTPEFLSMIELIESYIAGLSGTFIDATEGGARIKGTEVSTLAEVMDRYCPSPFELPDLSGQPELTERVNVCLAHLGKTNFKLTELLNECQGVVEKATWAHDCLVNQQKKGGDIEITEELADTINFIRQKHVELFDDNRASGWAKFTPILDTLMGEVRLELHKQKIDWLKKYPEMSQGLTLSGLLWEMFSNKQIFKEMSEATEWFDRKIAIAVKRLHYMESDALSQKDASEIDLLNRGQILLESMDISEAKNCLHKVLNLNQDNGLAQLAMGRVCLARRKSDEAMTHFRQATDCDASLKKQIDSILAKISAEYLSAAKDRIRRNRAGSEKFLKDILPEFPDYHEAQRLLQDPGSVGDEGLQESSMEHDKSDKSADLQLGDNKIWKDNLHALSRFHPALYKAVSNHHFQPVGNIVNTPAGCPNLQFNVPGNGGLFAYREDNPWSDAAIHLKTIDVHSKGLVVFVGMGLGYGPLQVLSERKEIPLLVIFEPHFDLFYTALQTVDLRPLIQAEKVSFFVADMNLEAVEKRISRLAATQDTHFLRHVPSFQWDTVKYPFWDNKVFMLINHLNTQGGTTRARGKKYFETRLTNMSMIRDWKRLDALRNIFQNKPAVLVAAGPSLDQSLPLLQDVQDRCVLIAVDSAVVPLMNAGITPDFVTTLDCQEVNFEKVTPLLGKKWPFSLVAMTKSTPLISQRIQTAHKFLAFQEDLPQMWMMETLGVKAVVPAAFSVAHLNLGLALVIGADPIIFVGQDLAYTSSDSDHAVGTRLIENMKNGLPADKEVFYAQGVDGSQLPTDRGLISLQKLFEDIIAVNPARKYVNATTRGLRIDGTESVDQQTAKDLCLQEQLAVAELVGKALKKGGDFPAPSFIKMCGKILKQVKNAKQTVSKSIGMTESVLEQIERIQLKKADVRNFQGLPSALADKIRKINQINRDMERLEDLWKHVLELIYQALTDSEEQRVSNQKLRQSQPYLKWLSEELNRARTVNREREKALAVYLESLGRLEDYLRREQKMVGNGGKNDLHSSLKKLSSLYVRSGKYCLAYDTLQQIAPDQQTDDSEVQFLMGEVMAGFLDFQAAERHWRTAIDLEPSLAKKIRKVRHESAELWIAFMEEKGALYPHLMVVWLERVAQLVKAGEQIPDSLQKEWHKILTKVEDELARDQTEAALHILEPWESMQNALPDVRYWKARCFHAAGDYNQAILEIEEVLEDNHENALWLSFSARLMLESGRFDQGLDRLQKAVALDVQYAIIWEELGDALMVEGDYENAIIVYESCFQFLPERTQSLLKMGDAYLQNRQLDAAVAAYQAVCAKDPGNVEAQKRLAVLKT